VGGGNLRERYLEESGVDERMTYMCQKGLQEGHGSLRSRWNPAGGMFPVVCACNKGELQAGKERWEEVDTDAGAGNQGPPAQKLQ